LTQVERTTLAVLALLAIGLAGCGGGSGSRTAEAPASTAAPSATRPLAKEIRQSLPAPVSGEAAVAVGGRVLIVGGVDSGDASTSSVLRFDPSGGRAAAAGSLSQPLHDAAAAALPSGTLVFGGGSAETIEEVEELRPDGVGAVIGHLPRPASDLSAARVGDFAVVVGGYDGAAPLDSVLRTSDGRRFARVARLPVPVRYASLARSGSTVYVLGGELASGLDSDRIQAVDLAGGAASVVGRLPGPLSHASTVELGGATYILGGRRAGHTTDQVLRFDPGRPGATVVGRLPAPVQNAAAAAVGGAGYLFGGLDSQGTTLSTIVRVRLAREPG
jgi:hypothetical protein